LQEQEQQAEQHALKQQQVLQQQAAMLGKGQLETELLEQQNMLLKLRLNPTDKVEHAKQITSRTAAFSMLV